MFSDQNRITFGYNGVLNRKTENNTLGWNFDASKYTPDSFKSECIRTAELIGERARQANRIPIVLLSGGLDSEVVCRSFIDAGVPFKAISVNYPNGHLAHETEFIDRFVSRCSIVHQYITRDWYDWIPKNRSYFDDGECTYSVLMPLMEAVRISYTDLNGLPIVGTGDTRIERIQNEYFYTNHESLRTPLYKFASSRGIECVPLFFQYTPELVLSMLHEPEIERMCQGDLNLMSPFRSNDWSPEFATKYDVYSRHWSDLEVRQKKTQYQRNWAKYKSLEGAWVLSRKIRYDEVWKIKVPDLLSILTRT